jgi:hypothetical protein
MFVDGNSVVYGVVRRSERFVGKSQSVQVAMIQEQSHVEQVGVAEPYMR